MKASTIIPSLLVASIAAIDLYSLTFVNHYIGIWTTITLLVTTTTLGLTLLKWAKRKKKRFLAERYGGSIPSDVAAIMAQKYLASGLFTIALLFPGFLSDLVVILAVLPSLSARNIELSIEAYRKEAARQGKSVEEMCTPAACPAVERIRKGSLD